MGKKPCGSTVLSDDINDGAGGRGGLGRVRAWLRLGACGLRFATAVNAALHS